MPSEQWVNLTEYSSKYRVSVSTLRRRIKAGQLDFRMECGRYYLRDAELSEIEAMLAPEKRPDKRPDGRDDQIIRLKEEVGDLQTLVRCLEDDNDRMRAYLGAEGAQPDA